MPYENAVTEDKELLEGLSGLHPKFGDLVEILGEKLWGMKAIDQKTKCFLCIAIDIANQGIYDTAPFLIHVDMAVKQGATREEIEEMVLFCAMYCGFPKVAPALAAIKEYFEK